MTGRAVDVAVVGAGPAGLAVAIDAARRGLSVRVFERRRDVADKACGEGIMPSGVSALETLGVRDRLPPEACRTFRSIRYVDERGLFAEGRLPGAALAVRRTVLMQAMIDRARELGVDLRFGCGVVAHERSSTGVIVETAGEAHAARMLVAADGLASRLRRAEGLDVPSRGARRFGMRRHFGRAPWTSAVEVHWTKGAEAYVTPVADDCVGVAFLFTGEESSEKEQGSEGPWRRLADKFPRLMSHLDGAPSVSKIKGAGPLERGALSCVSDRFALVGDAAGYIDAITGEGISLSLLSAVALSRILPEALAKGAGRAALAPYEREFRRLFRRYAFVTHAVLAAAARPPVRGALLTLLGRFPPLFDWLLAQAMDAPADAAAHR